MTRQKLLEIKGAVCGETGCNKHQCPFNVEIGCSFLSEKEMLELLKKATFTFLETRIEVDRVYNMGYCEIIEPYIRTPQLL